jgi:hypothetical protein
MDVPIRKMKVGVVKKDKEIEIFCNITKAGDIQHMHEVLPGSIPSLDVDATCNDSLKRHCRYAWRSCCKMERRVAKAICTTHKA